MDIYNNNNKGFLSGDDEVIKEKIKGINSEIHKQEKDKAMLKELETENENKSKEDKDNPKTQRFNGWYENNKDYLMREYIDEHQAEFRQFCGNIFMGKDEDEEMKEETLNDKDLKIK